MVVTALLVMSIIFNYSLWMAVERTSGRLLSIDSMPTNMKMYLALEILINIVMPYPFTMKYTFKEKIYISNYEADKRYDTVLLTIMFLFRFYHLVRGTLVMTYFMNNRAHRIWWIYGNKWDESFSFKSIFKTNSFIATLVAYLITWAIFGTLYRYNEKPSRLQFSDLFNFTWANSMWWAFITMTSVGYGDFYPKSEFGRIVGVFWALTGALIQSLFTVSFLQILAFENLEENAFQFILSLKKKKKLALRAAKMMTTLFKFKRQVIKII